MTTNFNFLQLLFSSNRLDQRREMKYASIELCVASCVTKYRRAQIDLMFNSECRGLCRVSALSLALRLVEAIERRLALLTVSKVMSRSGCPLEDVAPVKAHDRECPTSIRNSGVGCQCS